MLLVRGKAAKVNGYRVAGKTATAEMDRTGEKYMAGFAGIAPVNNPEIVVVLNVADPKGPLGHQGSTIAAPIVGSIIDETLRYLEIEPEFTITDNNIKEKIIPSVTDKTFDDASRILAESGFKIMSDDTLNPTDVITEQIPKVGASLMEGSTVRVYINENEKQKVEVPDLRNMSTDKVISKLSKLGLNTRIIGNGYVLTQEPSSGTIIDKGSIVTIKCVETLDLP